MLHEFLVTTLDSLLNSDKECIFFFEDGSAAYGSCPGSSPTLMQMLGIAAVCSSAMVLAYNLTCRQKPNQQQSTKDSGIEIPGASSKNTI